MESSDVTAQVRDSLIEALGKQSSFWGLGKTTGEIFAVLYLSRQPVALAEIAGHLKVTKGNVSLAVRNLERLGMVRRSWRKGERKVYFEAETDFWKITRTVLEQRQKPEFDGSFRLVEKSLQAARGLPAPEDAVHLIERLENLSGFYKTIDHAVDAILAFDPGQIKAMARMMEMFKRSESK